MRKTALYLVILGFLGFAVYYFLIKKPESPYSPTEAGFTIKDTASIGKIFIAAHDGESVTVERTDSGWMVNKQYKALKSTLDLILETFYKQYALYPVTQSAHDVAIKNLSTDGIKVEVYDRAGKKMKVFYVGGVSVNNTGTNMLLEGATQPYVIHVDGFSGYLTSRFTSKLKDWRDRTIFNIAPEEIKSVSMQYAEKPINSFTILRNNGKLVVDADTNVTRHLDPLNERRANVYLKYFGNVNCEGYLHGLGDMDSSLATAPKHSTIELHGMHGQHQRVDIFWMAINKRSKNVNVTNPDVPDDYDADRMYAVINDFKDTIMIQHFVFDRIFRKAYEFYSKDAVADPNAPKEETPKNVMMHK